MLIFGCSLRSGRLRWALAVETAFVWRVAGLALLVGALSSCAGQQQPSERDWEEMARQRAAERWQSLIEGRVETAYGYLAPGYRQINPYDRYFRTIRGVGLWKAADVKKATCEQDRCEVTTELTVEVHGPGSSKPIESVSWVQERWIIDRDQRQVWFVPNK